jgi:hypothetical protein
MNTGTLTADHQRLLEQLNPQQLQVAARLIAGRQAVAHNSAAALSPQAKQQHPSYVNGKDVAAGSGATRLVYEDIDLTHDRASVPGGWIVRAHTGLLSGRETIGIVFVPDVNHQWK